MRILVPWRRGRRGRRAPEDRHEDRYGDRPQQDRAGHGIPPPSPDGPPLPDGPLSPPGGLAPNPVLVGRYLRRLGLSEPPGTDPAGLRVLHRAHAERVPYSTVEMVLGRRTPVDEASCVSRVLAGRGGYCFHLNIAFCWLLRSLGFVVTMHRAGVQTRSVAHAPGADGTHLSLTVDLGRKGRWLADVGLGSGLHSPARLSAGSVHDGSFVLGLRPSEVVPGGWRLDHDPRAESFTGMDLDGAPVRRAVALARHEELSTSPSSSFTRRLTVQRREADTVDALLPRSLRRIELGRTTVRPLASPAELRQAMGDVFDLDVVAHGVDEAGLRRLYDSG